MESELFKAILQTGAAGAVIAVVWLFLRFLEEERVDRAREREGIWTVLRQLASAIEQLNGRLAEGRCPFGNNDERKGER